MAVGAEVDKMIELRWNPHNSSVFLPARFLPIFQGFELCSFVFLAEIQNIVLGSCFELRGRGILKFPHSPLSS